MSKKCPVLTLKKIAFNKLLHFLNSTILINTSGSNANIQHIVNTIILYLIYNNASPNIYEQLLNVVLRSGRLTSHTKFIFLRILLNDYVHTLIFEAPILIALQNYYLHFINNGNAYNLKNINFYGLPCYDHNEQYFIKIIENNTNLKELQFARTNDEVLKSIAKNSKHLISLNIINPVNITSVGVSVICAGVCRTTLTYINIGFNLAPLQKKLTSRDIILLLLNLPNLQILLSYVGIGSALVFIDEYFNSEFKTKLIYIEDTTTDHKAMDAIIKMCPKLTHLLLIGPEPTILYKLNEINNLKHFKLSGFTCNQFMESLHFYGKKLKYLNIKLGCGTMDIGKIALYCPNLLQLNCVLIDSIAYDYLCNGTFKNLRVLEINECVMEKIHLLHFFYDTITLTHLILDEIEFTDADIFRFLYILYLLYYGKY